MAMDFSSIHPVRSPLLIRSVGHPAGLTIRDGADEARPLMAGGGPESRNNTPSPAMSPKADVFIENDIAQTWMLSDAGAMFILGLGNVDPTKPDPSRTTKIVSLKTRLFELARASEPADARQYDIVVKAIATENPQGSPGWPGFQTLRSFWESALLTLSAPDARSADQNRILLDECNKSTLIIDMTQFEESEAWLYGASLFLRELNIHRDYFSRMRCVLLIPADTTNLGIQKFLTNIGTFRDLISCTGLNIVQL